MQAELQHPDMARARVSLVASTLKGPPKSLLSIAPLERRVPASNAKLLTSTAAALTLAGKYRFGVQVYQGRRNKTLYVKGTGDPVLKGRHLDQLAKTLVARGVRTVRGVVVDDRHFDSRRLAPGFEAFSEGAHYRPTSGALNVDGNAVIIKVSAPAGRRRPRVDVTPPSDYVKVRKRVRFSRKRRGAATRQAKIAVEQHAQGAVMWLTISGRMGRKARPWSTRRAVYDPALNVGWTLRRALINAGAQVKGVVRRGRVPSKARLLARQEHGLGQVLLETNRDSNNLCAENLVRAMGTLGPARSPRGRRGDTWKRGLDNLAKVLKQELGLTGFKLGNGSGLHRTSWVTAGLMKDLLRKIHGREDLKKLLLPTLAVAGQSGTLRQRFRDTAAQGKILAKTGTLSRVMALTGYVDLAGPNPLVFSLLINGASGRKVRQHMDRVAVLLARYARGLELDPAPESQPVTTQPASQPASRDER